MEEDPYVGVNLTQSLISEIGSSIAAVEEGTELQFVRRYLIADLIVILCLFLLKIASDTLGLSGPERKSRIIGRLTYGSIAPSKAKEIFKYAKELAAESVKSMIPATRDRRPYHLNHSTLNHRRMLLKSQAL